MSVAVSLDGEHLFSGELERHPLMFWHAVKVAGVYDWDTVLDRLTDIRSTRGIHFESSPHARIIAVPPAYTVAHDDGLTIPASQEGGTP